MTGALGAEANAGVVPVREGFGFDMELLTAWLQDNVAGFHGPVELFQFKGGQSNPTFKLVAKSGDYMLRRKPPGQLTKGRRVVGNGAERLASCGYGGQRSAFVHQGNSRLAFWWRNSDSAAPANPSSENKLKVVVKSPARP